MDQEERNLYSTRVHCAGERTAWMGPAFRFREGQFTITASTDLAKPSNFAG